MTVGLAFIAKTKKEAEAVKAQYGKYFDEVYSKVGTVKDFAEARNAVLAQVKTDYWVWVDCGDTIVGLEHLPEILEEMEDGPDIIFAPYHYDRNERETLALQWRERIIRTGIPMEWKGAVHETLVPVNDFHPKIIKDDRIQWLHEIKTEEQKKASADRNHEILVREWKTDKDPRIAYYLGLSHYNLKQWDEAIEMFLKHIETSGWDEERYWSWCKIAEIHSLTDQPAKSISAALAASRELPHFPDAYLLVAQAYHEAGDFKKSNEWLDIGLRKEAPKTNSVIDPTVYTYRPRMLAALNYANLGDTKSALASAETVAKMAPHYPPLRQWLPALREQRFEEQAVEQIRWLGSYLFENGGDTEKLFEAIPQDLMEYPSLQEAKNSYRTPKIWPEKSIVFYCSGDNFWGPETLKDGMGGSEEAITYLSRELSKLGWQVTVFNPRTERYIDKADGATVFYQPLHEFNNNDTFDVLVAWRAPSMHRVFNSKARVRAVDMHDLPQGHQAISSYDLAHIDKVLFKGKFQRDHMPSIPDEKVAIIPNGLVADQFGGELIKKRKHSVGWYSSYDRGLPTLLQLWPYVREQFPDATLDIYYGWDTFDIFHKSNPEQMRWKWQVIRHLHDLKNQGVKEHGRVSHEELAKAMKEIEVWAYPTGFPEIHCITAIKAGASGQVPVTSGYAALQESVLEEQPDYGEKIYGDEKLQEEFVQRLIEAIRTGRTYEERKVKAKEYIDKYNWGRIAEQWQDSLS